MKGYVTPEVLVTTQWVADHLNDPKVRIVESNEDILLYNMGHVPGAVQIDWQKDLNDAVRRDYLTREQFEQLLSANGIANDTTVIFYGDKNNWWACYAFWVFHLFGHNNAKVMDGGRAKWEADGRPMVKEVPSYPATAYKAQERADYKIRAFRDQVLAHVQSGMPLVDVRSPGEYSGELLHMPNYPQEGAMRGGHIPGARNVPWARAANPDGTFKPADELRAIYEAEIQRQRHRLLPHRRTLQPHLVRVDLPAGLSECPQLRRQLDRVGQPGRCTDRKVEHAVCHCEH
jgi:thiosulfate/3-mercaptopyruvate sulfurtransferase